MVILQSSGHIFFLLKFNEARGSQSGIYASSIMTKSKYFFFYFHFFVETNNSLMMLTTAKKLCTQKLL